MPRPLLPALLVLAALAALPATASAAATVTYVPGPAGTLTVQSTADERNVISVGRDGDEIVVTEAGDPASITTPLLSLCTASGKTVRCPDNGVLGLEVRLGPGDDGYTPPAAPLAPLAVATLVDGEAGADILAGADVPERLDGAAGDDTLDGGPGNDELVGGEGADTVSYAGANVPVRLVLGEDGAETGGNGRRAVAGAEAEDDKVSGVERGTGGPDDDELIGNGGPNALTGGGGDDRLDGGGGADTVAGGAGADDLDGGVGADTVLGEGGDDDVMVRDAVADARVDCGAGVLDEVVADNGTDPVVACEWTAPQTVTPPALTGDAVENAVLRLTGPVLTGSTVGVRREWFRCAPDRTACELIPLAPTTFTYRLTAAEVDKVVFARVTSTNRAGETVDDTLPTAVVAPAVPRAPGTPRPPRQPGTRPATTPTEFGPGAAAAFARLAAPSLARRGTRLELTAGQRVTCRATNRECGVDVVVTARVKVKAKARRGSKRRRTSTRTLELGYARRVLAPGASADLVVRLKKSARKVLRPGRRVTLVLKVEALQAGSTDSALTRRLRVRIPRR